MDLARYGQGPGEFREPWSLSLIRGDTIAVWDKTLNRLTFLSPSGAFISQRPLVFGQATEGRVRAVAVQGPLGGRVMAWAIRHPGTSRLADAQRAFVWRTDTAGLPRDSVVSMDGPQSIVATFRFGATRLDAPLQRRPFVLFRPDGSFIVANNDHQRIELFDTAGRRVKTVTLQLPPAPRVTSKDRAAYRDSTLASVEREMAGLQYGQALRERFRTAIKRVVDQAQYPSTRPFYEQIIRGDDQSELWVLLPASGSSYHRRWRVVDSTNGALRREIEIPHRANVVAATVREGALYSVEWTRDGIPRVAMYRPR
jgi:hypothetical protein